MAHQARLRTLGADLRHGEARAGAQAQAQGRAQQLTAAGGAVDFDQVRLDHVHLETHSVERADIAVRPSELWRVTENQPLTHTTCRSVCTISTRSSCAAITASIGL